MFEEVTKYAPALVQPEKKYVLRVAGLKIAGRNTLHTHAGRYSQPTPVPSFGRTSSGVS